MTAPAVVVGFGMHGRAVTRALVQRDFDVVAIDDRPDSKAAEIARALEIDLVTAPAVDELRLLIDDAAMMVPTPGLPEAHPAFELASEVDTDVVSEFDLARWWDDRPLLAVTGTNGKTTVTEWATQMLEASGRRAQAVGNTDTALVAAIDDPTFDVFVVEASSFRLAATQEFRPHVATWLNFGPDHLDVHASLETYEAAKARIWRDQGDDDIAVVNLDDPIVLRNRPTTPIVRSIGTRGDYREHSGSLWAGDIELVAVDDLWRRLPHDRFDALAAVATALPGGANTEGIRDALRSFAGLAHRVELVVDRGGVSFYNDSKATTPHAVAAALAGFESAVLIAGGRNKGIDLSPMADRIDNLRAVVAIGEAADEIASAFATHRSVVTADSMDAAVAVAIEHAEPGDAVLLSPGCASFDWYANYGARGDDFARAVLEQVGDKP